MINNLRSSIIIIGKKIQLWETFASLIYQGWDAK